MSKIPAIVGSSIGAIALGVALFAYSPSTCACLTPVQMLASAAGLHSKLYQSENLTAAEIEAGLNNTLRGTKPGPRQLFPAPDLGCEPTSPTLTRCYVETGRSWFLAKGFRVDITQAADGTYLNARVSKFWGHRPNNSFKPKPLRGSA